MLRRHLELAGDVVLDQFAEERILLIGQQVVKADAAADEHLFYPRQGAQGMQQLQIV